MKSSKLLLLLTVLCGVVICSCKKSSNSNQSATTSSRPAYEKRWNISSATLSQRPAGLVKKGSLFSPGNIFAHRPAGPDTNYTAIEFLINTYVIFYADNTVQVGQYSATNDTTLILDSLGTIHITSIDSSSFSFTLIPSGGGTITITATVASPVGSFSSASDLAFVSNTWKLDSITENGVLDSSQFVIEDSISATDTLKEIDAIFSEYGTYLVRDVYFSGEQDYNTNTWLWTNSSHTGFCYGNWDGTNVSDCTGLQSVAISFSPSYNQMIIQGEDSDSTYEIDYLTKQ